MAHPAIPCPVINPPNPIHAGANEADVDSARFVIQSLRGEVPQSDTTVLIFQDAIHVFLRNGVRVVFNIELAFADKPE